MANSSIANDLKKLVCMRQKLWFITIVLCGFETNLDPLLMTDIEIENGPVKIVSFPVQMLIFHSCVNVYQRLRIPNFAFQIHKNPSLLVSVIVRPCKESRSF